MPAKQYYIPDMPGPEEAAEAAEAEGAAEAHTGFHSFLDKLRGLDGVHDVTVDHTNKQLTVHLHEGEGEGEEYLPGIDQAIFEFGQLPGFTGQA